MRRRAICALLAVLMAGSFGTADAHAKGAKAIAVIFSSAIAPYRDALTGFKEALVTDEFDPVYTEYLVGDDAKAAAQVRTKIRECPPDLIYAIGTSAALLAKEEAGATPVVFSMVLNPIENKVVPSLAGSGKGMTGVCLNIPADAQLAALTKVAPRTKRIGLLYNTKAATMSVGEAEKAAQKAGVELTTEPVFSEADVSRALDKVLARTDSLWAVADPMIYNSVTASPIILATIKNRVSFMAFSRNFVKAGALLAVECDYLDIGRQAGEIAKKTLGDGPAEPPAVIFPRRTILVINKRTATTIGLTIPGDLPETTVFIDN